jgi:hypothetical protein
MEVTVHTSLWRTISIISLLVVASCSSDSADSIIYRHLAEVDATNVRLLDGERNLEITASGNHRNGCRRLDGYDVATQEAGEAQPGSIAIQLWEWQPDRDPNVGCTDIAPPFSIIILVDVATLPSGQYEVDVNGLSRTITLSGS